MPDVFISGFLNTLLSQYGAFVCGLIIALWYCASQWSAERKEHRKTTEMVFQLLKDTNEAANANANALTLLRATFERRD